MTATSVDQSPSSLGDYRRTSHEIWEAMAPGWERWRAQLEEALAPVREWLITELTSQPGDTVLELGAGPGDTVSRPLALLGELGRLISTDFSPEMVEVARRRGAELGLENVDYRVIDAEQIELPADFVDGVLCQSGYMLMADPAAALSETRRVLRPGGAWRCPCGALLSTTRGPRSAAGFSSSAATFRRRSPAPRRLQHGERRRTRMLLEEAGFTEVRTDEVPVRFAFDDLDPTRDG